MSARWLEARERAQFVRDFLAVDSTQAGGYLDELSSDVLALLPIVEAAESCAKTWRAHGYSDNHIPDALALDEALREAARSNA